MGAGWLLARVAAVAAVAVAGLGACGHSGDTGIEIDIHVPDGLAAAAEIVLYIGQVPGGNPPSGDAGVGPADGGHGGGSGGGSGSNGQGSGAGDAGAPANAGPAVDAATQPALAGDGPWPEMIQTQHSGRKVPALLYRRDPHNRGDRIALTPGKSDYVFYFQAGGADQPSAIAVVAAVVVTADNQPLALGVLTDLSVAEVGHVYRYPVTLVPATDLAHVSTAAPDVTGVELWPDEPAGHFADACARIAQPGVATDLLFVNDKDDPDCDSFTTTECDPDVFDATTQAEVPPTKFTCTGERTASVPGIGNGNPSDRTICEAGAPACVDGKGSDGCGGSAYCMQNAVCEACADPSDAACMLAVPSAIVVHCTFAAAPAPQDQTVLELCGHAADLPVIVTQNFDNLALLQPDGQLGSAIPFATGSSTIQVGGTGIEATGSIAAVTGASNTANGLLFASLLQGSRARGIAVPFHADIHPIPDCGSDTVTQCVIDGPTADEVFLDCLKSAPPPGDALQPGN